MELMSAREIFYVFGIFASICRSGNSNAAFDNYELLKPSMIIYGESDIAVSEDGAVVNNIWGYYKLVHTPNGHVYAQMRPNYFEDPRVLYPYDNVGWLVLYHSTYLDYERLTEKINNDTSYWQIYLSTSSTSLETSEFFNESNIYVAVNGFPKQANNIFARSTSELAFTDFGDAWYTHISIPSTFVDAQEICKGLDGSLAAPVSSVAVDFLTNLAPNNEPFWTGFYRESENSSDPLNWKINDGSGEVFETTEHDLIGSGCVIQEKKGGTLSFAKCSNENNFGCQTSQYYYFQNYWTRFFPAQASLNFTALYCQDQRKGSFLKRTWATSFFQKYTMAFDLDGEYWLDLRWNAKSGQYLSHNGNEHPYVEWVDNQRDPSLGECVVYQLSSRLAKSVSCDGTYGIACQYLHTTEKTIADIWITWPSCVHKQEINVATQSFVHQETYGWMALENKTFDEAVETCHQHNQEVLVINNANNLPGLFQEFYSDSTPIMEIWVRLGPRVAIEDEYFKFNSEIEPTGLCAVMANTDIPRARFVSCDSNAFVSCVDRNTFGFIPYTHKFCPEGFTNMADTICLASLTEPVPWNVAYDTCKDQSAVLTGQGQSSLRNWRFTNVFLYMTTVNLKEAWLGPCTAVYSSFKEHNRGDCLYMLNNGSSSGFFLKPWERSFPFICQSGATNKPSSVTIELAEGLRSTQMSSSSCLSSDSEEEPDCYLFEASFASWNESCVFDLYSYDSPEVHEKLVKNLQTYERFSESARAWIGLQVVNGDLIWENGQSSAFAAWENESVLVNHKETSCVSVNVDGFWNLETCSFVLPSFCAVEPTIVGKNLMETSVWTTAVADSVTESTTILSTKSNKNTHVELKVNDNDTETSTNVVVEPTTNYMESTNFMETTTSMESTNFMETTAMETTTSMESTTFVESTNFMETTTSVESTTSMESTNFMETTTSMETTSSFNSGSTTKSDGENQHCEAESSTCEFCKWSSWIDRYQCSKTCGDGLVKKFRQCLCGSQISSDLNCDGNSTIVVACNESACPVNGGWSEWSSWNPKDAWICGVRNVSRFRACDSPAPSDGGLPCIGMDDNNRQSEIIRELAVQPCPHEWTWGAWTLFSSCTATCGEGASRSRTRKCEWDDREFADLKECTREETQTLQCGRLQCPIDGNWGEWSDWSPCSASCATGKQFRLRLCNKPIPTSDGAPCEGSITGSQSEEQTCDEGDCPPEKYQADENNYPHCPEEVSAKTSIEWSVAYSGTIQGQPCPEGSVGHAYRKCSQNHIWMDEDLSDCVVSVISKLVNVSESSKPDRDKFEETMRSLTETLSQDHYGTVLKSSGDLHAVPRAVKWLLRWRPFEFGGRSRSSRLDYAGLIATTVENAVKTKYKKFWQEMNVTSKLGTFQEYLTVIDEAGLEASKNLDYLSYEKFESSFSEDFRLMLTTTLGWENIMKFPEEDSPELGYDSSYIELPLDVFSLSPNDTVRLTFTKFSDPDELLSSMDLTSLPFRGQKSFGDRKLNSAIVGVQAIIDGRLLKEHRLNSHVYIKFYHKRWSEDPVCVFVDLDSKDGIFNDDGCEVWKKRDNWTLCRCNHLTSFALLAHDVNDVESWWRRTIFHFKSKMSGVNFFCIAFLVAILVLLFYPKNGDGHFDSASFFAICIVLLRYAVVQVVLWLSDSQTLCLIGSSALMYALMLCCVWHGMRLLDVYVEVASLESSEKASSGVLAWVLSLVAPCCPILIYMLYDIDHQWEHRLIYMDCKALYSIDVLLPSYVMIGFVALWGVFMLITIICKFNKMKKIKKPIESYRNEKQIWLKSFAYWFGTTVVTLTILMLHALDIPSDAVQISYMACAVIEVLYLLYSEVWMNLEIRSFYYHIFEAKPPKETVYFEPPRYIP